MKSQQEIFECLTKVSRTTVDGLEILSEIKKECNCTTDDILRSQAQNSVKTFNFGDRKVYSHTSIYDYGIEQKDIENSRKLDKKQAQ